MDDRVEIPSLKFTAELDLKDETHDNYLDIALSGGDVYKVEFLLEDKSDFILISTAGRGDQSYMYFIPDAISTRGYKTIKISAMRGDGDYWIQNISTTNDPDFIEFPDHEIVDFEIKKMEIEIGEDEYSKIKAKRAQALELGILLTVDADYVPAVITADGKKDDIEIRLKGDWTDHLVGGKWSFRIKMDDESVWGMKKFSIHRPETRDGVSEYLVQTFYRDHGGIALRYDFIDVLINGEYMGVYGIEEFFDKRLVENAFFREGPIIKVNEDYLWERRAYYYGRIEDWDFGLDPDARYMDFDVFGINQTLESEMLTGYTAYAITELNKLMAGQVAVEDIFEIEQFAKYFAILDIFNSCHGNIWHNMRYYFNPVTAKMEPITFDELPKEGLCDSSSKRNDPLIAPFFKNADFSKLYIKYLDQYIDEYDTFLEKEAYNLARIQTIFQRDGIYYKDYTTHLDELHYFIDSTLFEDDYKFRIERVSDSKLAIKINKKGYMGIQMETVSYDGQPVNARFTDYQNRVAVIEYAQPTTYDDLSKFTVTYITLKDGITHTESVANPEFDLAFYTAGHIYGSHDKAGTPEQDYIHPPFAAALPGIAENEDIAFGVLTGDTVYELSATSYGNLKAAMEITGKPYYIAPGNHDLDGSGLFSANFGSTNQSFLRGNALFIILTPRANWELDAEQLAFLDQTLQENQDAVSSIFILTHAVVNIFNCIRMAFVYG